MRTKNFLITLCVIVSVSLVVVIFGQHKPESFQSIVSTTNEQIRNFKDNLRDAETKTLNADQKYLNRLGFTSNPRLFPKDVWKNTSLPVIVSYVLNGQESQAVGFINNMAKIVPNNTVLVYNMGLEDYALKMLLNYCNSSRCQIITLDLSDFPSHVENENHAFRPLVIQDALQHTGSIFFLENHYRLFKNVTAGIIAKLYEEKVQKNGILAWPFKLKNPVSSLTHKKMFEYFHTDAENYLFRQMVKTDILFIVNSKNIHNDIMLPWILCTLTPDCIFPIGAQSVGCKFDKKPQYRYSGCHSYDASALNIVLGLKFNQDVQYTYTERLVNYFETIPLSKADSLLREIEQNSTTEGKSLPSLPLES